MCLWYSDNLKCSSCQKEVKNESPFLNLSLDVPDLGSDNSGGGGGGSGVRGLTLKDLFESHFQPEILDEANKWQCSGCNELVRAEKTQEYVQLPQMLMIHLKRFRFDQV